MGVDLLIGGDAHCAAKEIQRASNDSVMMRVVDVVSAACALIFLAPMLALTAALIYILDPGPVFFGHRRIGRNGLVFRCWKFRTMVTDAEARLSALLASDPEARAEWERDQKLRADPRVTPIGNFLRRYSIDEIPQLFNVVLGEMSLVGPRPIVFSEIGRYKRYFEDYCLVRPGVTGLWQISGRSDVSYRRRVALDVAYIRSRSLLLNLKIIFLTIPRVVLAQGSC